MTISRCGRCPYCDGDGNGDARPAPSLPTTKKPAVLIGRPAQCASFSTRRPAFHRGRPTRSPRRLRVSSVHLQADPLRVRDLTRGNPQSDFRSVDSSTDHRGILVTIKP